MGRYVLGVDNGGTFIKAALYDHTGKLIGLAKEPGHVIVERPGYVEMDMEKLWQTNCNCMRRVIQENGIDPQEIACIGIAGQGKGLYPVDGQGKIIRNAITSADNRSWEYTERFINTGVADQVFEMTYQGIYTAHPVSILAWLKDHEPEHYAQIRWVFSMKDYLVYRLTGQATADYCNQSGGCLLNFTTGTYDPEILRLLGIEEMADKLPPIYHTSDICGMVKPEIAVSIGCSDQTTVIAGMFDVDASSIAMGIVNEEQMGMIAGTCSINAYLTKAPITNRTVMFNSYYCIPGFYFVEEGSNTSAGNLEWVIQTLYPIELQNAQEEGHSLYPQLDDTVEAIAPGQSDVLFLPFLNGSQDSSRSRGVWLGCSPLDGRDQMLRAAYEGVVFSHRNHMEHLLRNRERPATLRLAGGASNSAVWVQMFADILQIPIEIIEGKELGAKGAAMAAGIAAGFYRDFPDAVDQTVTVKQVVYPQADKRDIYEKKYQRFLASIEHLHELWRLF